MASSAPAEDGAARAPRLARFLTRRAAAVVALGALVAACSSNRPAQQGYGQGQWNGGQYGAPPYGGNGQWSPQGANGQWGGPQGQPQYGAPPQGNLPPVPNDPINNLDLAWMRQRATSILAELIANLAPNQRARVDGIPLVSDDSPGEINAYAGCNEQGVPFMATTDGLLEIAAYSARFRANDEVFGTRKLDGYVQMVAQNSQPERPLPRPQQQFIDPTQDMDGRKVARQNVLFDAQLAFVLGHELGHHYLGHTGCAKGMGGGSGITLGDIGRVLSSKVPVFNQPNEIAADTTGTYNLMTMGSRRQSGRFQEEGALMMLNFFLALHNAGGMANNVLAVFESTHPSPSIRLPIVQQAANTWRSTGGNPPPVLGY